MAGSHLQIKRFKPLLHPKTAHPPPGGGKAFPRRAGGEGGGEAGGGGRAKPRRSARGGRKKKEGGENAGGMKIPLVVRVPAAQVCSCVAMVVLVLV